RARVAGFALDGAEGSHREAAERARPGFALVEETVAEPAPAPRGTQDRLAEIEHLRGIDPLLAERALEARPFVDQRHAGGRAHHVGAIEGEHEEAVARL